MKPILKQILIGTAVLLLLSVGVSLTACTEKTAGDPSGSWIVTAVDDLVTADQAVETVPTLNISLTEQSAWGNLSCNLYNAPITCDPERGELKLGVLSVTRMACENLEVELALGSALESIDRYALLPDGTLELYAGRQLRIRLTKAVR